jgi:hypothetical protein
VKGRDPALCSSSPLPSFILIFSCIYLFTSNMSPSIPNGLPPPPYQLPPPYTEPLLTASNLSLSIRIPLACIVRRRIPFFSFPCHTQAQYTMTQNSLLFIYFSLNLLAATSICESRLKLEEGDHAQHHLSRLRLDGGVSFGIMRSACPGVQRLCVGLLRTLRMFNRLVR